MSARLLRRVASWLAVPVLVSGLLFTLPHLRHLDVSRCKLTRLASSVAQLASLQSLDLHGNALTTLPFGLCRLTSLVLLDCTENPLPPPLAAAAGARVGWLGERPLHPLPLLTLLAVGTCVYGPEVVCVSYCAPSSSCTVLR